MNAVNAVQLLILAWTFTAVCQADDDDISVICEDVTGTVGEEVTLTCSVSLSLKCTNSCIVKYKFQYPEGDSEICKEFPQGSCEQRNSFRCRFTPPTAMTGQFRFFVQTQCGRKTTEFTVNTTEPIKPEIVTKAPGKKEPITPDIVSEDHDTQEGARKLDKSEPDRGFKVAVTSAVVSCFIIVILPIIYKIKQNYTQKRMFLENSPVNVI